MREKNVQFRATNEDITRWLAAAKKDGRSLGNWITYTCNLSLTKEVVGITPEQALTALKNAGYQIEGGA